MLGPDEGQAAWESSPISRQIVADFTDDVDSLRQDGDASAGGQDPATWMNPLILDERFQDSNHIRRPC